MLTTFRLNSSDLDESFLVKVRDLFAGKDIEINISESDGTEYLMQSSANREQLLEALHDVRNGKNTVKVDMSKYR